MMKILATIGPSCASLEDIKFISEKTSLFRLNGSHNTLVWHQETVEKIRQVAPDAFILMDIPGIKPRTANADPMQIAKNSIVSFGPEEKQDDTTFVKLTKPLQYLAFPRQPLR